MFRPNNAELSHEIIESVSNLASTIGYSVEKSPQGGASFQKKSKEVWTSFGFGILDYGEVKTILGFSAVINFPPLEELSHPILRKFGLMGGKTGEFGQTFWPPHIPFKNKLREHLEITDIVQLDEVKSAFKKFIPEDALPYFREWAHVEKAYELALQHTERAPLSNMFGPNWEFQKATLLHIFEDAKYEPFIDAFCKKREGIFRQYPDEEVAVQYYQAAFALREHLSKV